MDKQQYKEILSDSISETAYYKKVFEKMELMIKDTPNNMQLGKRIRSLYWAIRDERELTNDKV